MPKTSTSFPKGKSGNENGRPPKGYSITEMMKEMLTSQPEIKKAIGQSIAKKALQGDVTALKLLWNYLDGMPKQDGTLDLTTGGEKITGFVINFGNAETSELPSEAENPL